VKTFRYELGHEAGKTLTVGELRAELEAYPDDMPVMAEWEGVRAYVDPAEFYPRPVCKGMKEDEEVCLIMSVEKY